MEILQVRHYQIPKLGFGTYRLRGREATDLVSLALRSGYRHIDTAQMYRNEMEVGRAIRQSSLDRDDIWITTKVWHTELSTERFLPSVEASLERLSVDYVDLLLIHWPSPEVSVAEAVTNLMTAQDRDFCRAIGVSNFNLELMTEAMSYGAELITNQVEYHPFLDQSTLLDFAAAQEMALTAYAPLAQGQVFKDPVIQDIAEKHGKQPSQIALRWLLDQEPIIPIPMTSNPRHLRSNADVFRIRLDADDKRRLDQLTQQKRRWWTQILPLNGITNCVRRSLLRARPSSSILALHVVDCRLMLVSP
jgi:2,5-diketo-D-gluconate reductase B